MAISRFTVQYSAIVPSGSVCKNPTISYYNPQNLSVPCSNDDSLDIEINTDIGRPYCITFVVDCSDSCSSCGQILVPKCFCINGEDCENCSTCEGNVCVSRCEGQLCDNDTCVDCDDEHPCPQNQECSQGVCRCPADKPIKRADGKCVECLDGEDLGHCRICVNGTIVSIDCPNGLCNPDTGECQECYNNTHCTEPNQCCNEVGQCDCCPGFILDPETNQCVTRPPCTNAQYCIDLFGPCSYCTEDGCAPKVCPTGFVCDPTTGECVPECGNCPEGSGCINGMCVPCSQLSCGGEGLLCQYAVGCQCNDLGICEYINCNVETVDLVWDRTPSTPGDILVPGQPSLSGTTNIVPLGMVYGQAPNGSGYYNHQFNLGITNGTNGNWTLYNTPDNFITLGGGTSVSFDLTSTGPNLVGFIVKFVETGTGRTATWGIFRTPTAPLDQPNVWNYEFQSTGTPPTTSGGTQGHVQLCSTNSNFIPVGVTNVQTTGTISVTLIPTGTNCMAASISGCGTWNGDIILECGSTTVTVHADELTIDPANCCDPLDPNCDGFGTGNPCSDLTIQEIDLVALPTYGQAPSGDGEFLIVADWTSAGLSFIDLFYLNPADGCWSTANNPASSSNDIQIVTGAGQSPLGPSVSNLSVIATLGDGGCVRLGYTCELRLPGCRKLQGEVCLTECQAFSVNIIDLGGNVYTAVSSLNDEVVSYQWSVFGGGVITNPTGQTMMLAPAGGTSTIRVDARYGSPVVKCTAFDLLTISTNVPGCRNALACNYNPAANVDDGTCVSVGNPSYNCVLGGFQPGLISALPESMPAITWKISGIPIPTNGQIAPGTHTVDVFFNGVQKCSKTLVVPQCYRCSSGTCLPAPTGDNSGAFSTSDCDNRCSCLIDIQVQQVIGNGNRRSLVITATGDTGVYTASVAPYLALNVLGPNVLAPTTLNTSGSVSTGLLCPGQYRITVVGANCTATKDVNITNTCTGVTTALANINFDCATNQLFFDIVPDACSTSYTVQLLDNSLNVVAQGTYPNITSTVSRTLAVGSYPGDGDYTVKVTAGGCFVNYPLSLDCVVPNDCTITFVDLNYSGDGVNLSFTASISLSAAGGSYSVTLMSTTGGSFSSCNGAVVAGVIATQTITGFGGVNVVNFPNAVSQPYIPTCYAVVVQKLGAGNADCNDTEFTLFDPSNAPLTCGLTLTGTSYDTTNGNLILSWDGANTSNDITIQVKVSGTAVCSGGDPLIINESGRGEDGINIPFAIPQLSGQDQCVTIDIFDTNNPTCKITSTEYTILGCTCSVEIVTDSIYIDNVAETVEFDVRTRCTSGLVDIDISGDATGSATIGSPSTDGTIDTYSVPPIALAGYPSTGGTITIEATDDSDVGCIDTQGVVLNPNCVGCGQVVSFGPRIGGSVTNIFDALGDNIASGTYITPTDYPTLESDVEAGVALYGGNFCTTGTKVDAAVGPTIEESGMIVNQDSDNTLVLDYVEVDAIEYSGPLRVHFGNCGCDAGHVCDYTGTVHLDVDDTFVRINIANNNSLVGYTSVFEFELSASQTFSLSDKTAFETQLATFIESICSYTLGAVTASYDSGADDLTVTVTGTNAGMGLLYSVDDPGPGINNVVDFTQSGCV